MSSDLFGLSAQCESFCVKEVNVRSGNILINYSGISPTKALSYNIRKCENKYSVVAIFYVPTLKLSWFILEPWCTLPLSLMQINTVVFVQSYRCRWIYNLLGGVTKVANRRCVSETTTFSWVCALYSPGTSLHPADTADCVTLKL